MTARKRVRVALIAAVAGAAALILTGFTCADRFILPPVPPPSKGDGSARIEIPAKEGLIEVFHARSPGAQAAEPRAFVLRFSGDANQSAQFTASRWGERPIEAWVVNYPGYGGSAGPRTLRRLSGAALAAYDAIRNAAGGRPVILEGFSLGAVPALHVAANRPVAGLILQNPPALREIVLRHGWWNLWLLAAPAAWSIPGDLDSIANANRCGAAAVFLIADKDATVPPDIQRAIFDAYSGPKRLIVQVGAGHVDPLDEVTESGLREGMDWIMSR